MAGTAPPPPPQLQQQISSASASASVAVTATSAEEEAYKRNTDCVYFLASPLTCKKGSECEYRHSDIARVNPRDCWYWMHGNCLNPKCGFRHPPLDGLLGTQVPTPKEVSVPPSQAATTPAAPASYASSSGKQAVPCIFFQKGFCMKGDWCPFLHAPNTANNKVLQSPAATIATETPAFKKSFGGLEKCSQEKKVQERNIPKPVELPSQAKPVAKVESTPARNEFSTKKSMPPALGTTDEFHRYRSTDVSPVDNGNQVSWSNRVQQQPLSLDDHTSMNGKDPEEVSREPSPGFDVLVDNEVRDSDYYHSEDQFGRPDHDGRNEYFDGRSGDYSSMVDADRDMYHDSRGYDSYERLQGQYDWEQRRSSSERMSGSAHPERRQNARAESPDQVNESDLRHHLSKHRRANGLRSIINQEYAHDRVDERRYQNSRRDLRHDRERQESSLSSRLRGRIKIPGRSSSSDEGNDLRLDREIERGRDHSGLSPGRSQLPSRLRDRIKGNVQEDISNDGRNSRGPLIRRETISDYNADFAGPKSLAELRSRKSSDSNEQNVNDQPLVGKRKYSNLDYHPQTGDDLSFEGPKPLEEILKRKRGSRRAASGSATSYGNNEANTQNKGKDSTTKRKETLMHHFSQSQNDVTLPNGNDNEESKSASGVKSGTEAALSSDDQSYLPHNVNEAEVEDGMIVEDGVEDQEPETYDHGDEDSYYEQVDGEDYNLDDGDNGEPEEEYLDDDDGDDFAKKMGVMF